MRRHLLVIGGQRCGTTQLHAQLEAHPEIAMARPARPEPKVFLSAGSVERGQLWYESTYFSHATTESLLGEKSTSYLEVGAAAVHAAAVLGEAQIVAQLRDPVERAVSNWRFSTAHGLESRSLTDALELNLAGPLPWDSHVASVSPFAYLERGCYAGQLEPWLTCFAGMVKVRFLEDVRQGRTSIRDLYAGLGVDPGFAPVHSASPLNRSEGQPPELDATLRARLRAYFAPGDAQLRTLLGRELPWPSH